MLFYLDPRGFVELDESHWYSGPSTEPAPDFVDGVPEDLPSEERNLS